MDCLIERFLNNFLLPTVQMIITNKKNKKEMKEGRSGVLVAKMSDCYFELKNVIGFCKICFNMQTIYC